MKNGNGWILVFVMMITFSGSAQINPKNEIDSGAASKNLQIGFSKTTSIVFPYAIKSVDRGSQEVLVQKAKGAENILLVKAGIQNFKQTNLTVVTADGRLYGYILNYDDLCPILNLTADTAMDVKQEVIFLSENENQKKIKDYAFIALSKKKKAGGLIERKFEIKLQMNGMFIHQDIMYYRFAIGNESRINYSIDQLRFFIRDQKKSKRTASQEIEILPLFATSELHTIADKSEVIIVFAMPKFTIGEKKYFAIQMIEEKGGRHVELDIKNRDLENLEILNAL